MGQLFSSFPYGLTLVLMIVAIVHYFRTRPDGYWFFVIIFLGPLGAIAYLVVNVVMPLAGAGGAGIEGRATSIFAERRRIRELEIKIEENNLPIHCAELGEIFYRRGEYERAEPLLRRAAEKLDYEPQPTFYLALTLEKRQKPQEAAALLAPIVQKDPRYKFGEALLAYARDLAAAGRAAEAKAAFEQVNAQSTLPEARVRYGLLLAETGDLAGARVQFETAIRESRGLPRHNLRAARPYILQARAWLALHRG
jgi:hypothetical protein